MSNDNHTFAQATALKRQNAKRGIPKIVTFAVTYTESVKLFSLIESDNSLNDKRISDVSPLLCVGCCFLIIVGFVRALSTNGLQLTLSLLMICCLGWVALGRGVINRTKYVTFVTSLYKV